MKKLIDKYKRIHNYLRISLTDRCNFNCFYCDPDNECHARKKQLMSVPEILHIIKIFVEDYGISKIRFTGGEPLIRKEFPEILAETAKFPVELAITTNGFLLDRHLKTLKKYHLKSINISFDSLQEEKFNKIVAKKAYKKVLENIYLALQEGFHVKLNVVVIRGINEKEIPDFIELTKHPSIHVRFIEYMPFSRNRWETEKVFSYKDILSLIATKYSFEKLEDSPHSTGRAYKVRDFQGTFAIISSVSYPFCAGCNRIRLSADGKLRNCLFSPNEYDLLTPLRQGKNIREIIENAIFQKAYSRGGLPTFEKVLQHKNIMMRRIGG